MGEIFQNKDIKLYLIQHAVQPYATISIILPAYVFLFTKNIVLVGILLSIAYVLGHLAVIAGFLTDYIVNTRLYDFTLAVFSGLTLLISFLIYSDSLPFILLVYVILGVVHSLKGTNHRKVLRSISKSFKEFQHAWILTQIIRVSTSITFLYLSLFVIGLRYTFLILGLYMLLLHTPLIFFINYPKGTGSAKLIFNLTFSLLKGQRGAQFYVIDTLFTSFFSGLRPVFIGAFSLSSAFLTNYAIYFAFIIIYDVIYLLSSKYLRLKLNRGAFLLFRGIIPSFTLFTIIILPPSLYVIPAVMFGIVSTFYSLLLIQVEFSIPKEIYATFLGLNVTLGSLFNTLGNLLLPYMEITLGLKSVITLASVVLVIYSLIISYSFKVIR